MEYKTGQKLFVDFVDNNCKLKDYLVACGFVTNACIKILAISPLKKTLLISVSDSVISLKTTVLAGVVWKK